MTLFTTALGLYGGVLCSGELQGFIIHETMPTTTTTAIIWPRDLGAKPLSEYPEYPKPSR
jgi:hypothetical protein